MNLPYCEGPYNGMGPVILDPSRFIKFEYGGIIQTKEETENLKRQLETAKKQNKTEERIETDSEVKVEHLTKAQFKEREHLEILEEWARIQNIDLSTLKVVVQEDSTKTK